MTTFSAHIAGAGYGRLKIIQELTVNVASGKLLVVLGPNGAGKTTSLLAMMGTVTTSARQISLAGKDISGLETWQLTLAGVAFVPDGARCFGTLSVEDNLRGARYAVAGRFDNEEFHRRCAEVYGIFPILEKKARQLAGSLSGGQRQMLAVGRALMTDPKVILLDEPSAGLAPKLIDEMFEDLQRIMQARQTAIVMAEQNVAAAKKIADFCVVLEEGRAVLEGPMAEIVGNEKLRTAYIGL